MATATATAVSCSFSASGVIQGYHVYQRIWTSHVGEKATMVKEPGNEHNRFAVAVLEDETLCTVGHLTREESVIITVCGESLVFLGRPGPFFVCFVGGSALGFNIGSGMSFGSLLK